ncbi:MAG: HU family DNA-binding protein [Clostridia bacterium]|nr:HU family DNA-binding protein [Clostridia bacterium]MBR4186571.1 HU family DNA-binding protein [Clostridia bacterium]
MNKQELIKKIAADAGLTQKQAAAALEATVNAIETTVADGKKVSLIGFGTFESKKREARISRNPRTGEAVNVAASTVPAFKAGKEFKDKVNG